MLDFADWMEKQIAALDAEVEGSSSEVEIASPAVLESTAFMSDTMFSPAALMGSMSAYNTIQAHRRDLAVSAKTRLSYYQEQATEAALQKVSLAEKATILTRLSLYKENA